MRSMNASFKFVLPEWIVKIKFDEAVVMELKYFLLQVLQTHVLTLPSKMNIQRFRFAHIIKPDSSFHERSCLWIILQQKHCICYYTPCENTSCQYNTWLPAAITVLQACASRLSSKQLLQCTTDVLWGSKHCTGDQAWHVLLPCI